MTDFASADDPGPDDDYRVTPLELFFDLVFVFALTQVTGLIAEDLTAWGVLRGLGALMAVWWAWVGYSWLTNSVPIDENDKARLIMVLAMIAMFVMGAAIPHAFYEDGVLFGAAYLVVTSLFLVLYWVATSEMPDVQRAVGRIAPGVLFCPLLILLAGFLDAGWLRGMLWATALTVSFVTPLIAGSSGWRVRPNHFAERHGLIIIIALGESIVALGLAVSDNDLTIGPVVAGALGVAIVASMWWLYFDVVALVAERHLHEVTGEERNAVARDSYSYIHLVMVAGIVLLALGLKKTLVYGTEPFGGISSMALFGGMAVYLFGHLAFRLRNVRSLNVPRTVVAITLLVAIPLGTAIAAYASLAILTAICVLLVAYEVVRYRKPRNAIRHAEHSHS